MTGNRNKAAALALLLCASLLLSSCVQMTFESTEGHELTPLPTPDISAVTAPTGDSRDRYGTRVTLYYDTQEGVLSPALRLVYVDAADDENDRILRALLEPPYASSGLLPIAPEGTRLLHTTLLCGVLTVDLSAEALSRGEEFFFTTRAAIGMTMLARPGIDAVNVLVEGRACESSGMPLGAVTAQQMDVAAGFVQQITEQMLIKNGGGFVERCAVLYRPDPYSGALLPERLPLRITEDDPIVPLLSGFATAVSGDCWPLDLLSEICAQVSITNAGQRLLTLQLPAGLYCARDLLAPALACTMAGFLPNIDAVRVFVDGQLSESTASLQATEAGLFGPQALRTLAQTRARLYYVDAEGRLCLSEQAYPGNALSARSLLARLIASPDAEENLHSAFPETATAADILGIGISDGIACVNISSALYGACQRMSEQEEQALVYAIVNTLVDNLPMVSSVQFCVAGQVTDTLAGSISIIAPLMASPGLADRTGEEQTHARS